jgi:pre-mRNA 3'-end-processing factor FIP1
VYANATHRQSKYSDIRNIPQRSTATDTTTKAASARKAETRTSSLPAISNSQIDVNAIPVHKSTGKRITAVNIDEDLGDNEKPWRKPGTDLSDYFNYGFDEFTWALYASKQEAMRGEYSQDAVTQNNKKMMEDINNMMMMGGMPGMAMPGMPGGGGGSSGGAGAGGGAAGGGAAGMASMPGMEGIPPEMQAMMQQMMASGMDPSQMDASAMSAMFAGMQNGAGGGGGGQGAQGQNFGGQGFGGGQGQDYGYQQQGMGNQGRGGFGGRGRGGRRW